MKKIQKQEELINNITSKLDNIKTEDTEIINNIKSELKKLL